MTTAETDFPALYREKIRFSDTDMLGHVNNLAFASFFESARADILYGSGKLEVPECFFVLASSTIDFTGELNFPGEVTVGSAIARIGTSSATFRQAVFQNGQCAASSTSSMVQIGGPERKAVPLSEVARSHLAGLLRLTHDGLANPQAGADHDKR
ncbi:MAG: acyl-CoA thioesterase [Thermomicrobiales bacterium]